MLVLRVSVSATISTPSTDDLLDDADTADESLVDIVAIVSRLLLPRSVARTRRCVTRMNASIPTMCNERSLMTRKARFEKNTITGCRSRGIIRTKVEAHLKLAAREFWLNCVRRVNKH